MKRRKKLLIKISQRRGLELGHGGSRSRAIASKAMLIYLPGKIKRLKVGPNLYVNHFFD